MSIRKKELIRLGWKPGNTIKPYLSPSAELSYILGVMKRDGNIERRAGGGRTIPWNKGRIYSPEIRRAISLGVKKKWQEPEYREKGLRHLKSLNQRREEFGCIRAG
jgi:hypothetical protein